jgi:hypothetical protein
VSEFDQIVAEDLPQTRSWSEAGKLESWDACNSESMSQIAVKYEFVQCESAKYEFVNGKFMSCEFMKCSCCLFQEEEESPRSDENLAFTVM